MKFEKVSNPYRKDRKPQTNWNNVLNDFVESGLRCAKLDASDYASPGTLRWSLDTALKHSDYKDTLECHMYNGEVLLMYSTDTNPDKVHRGRHK